MRAYRIGDGRKGRRDEGPRHYAVEIVRSGGKRWLRTAFGESQPEPDCDDGAYLPVIPPEVLPFPLRGGDTVTYTFTTEA